MALKARSRPTGIAVDIRKLDSAWQLTLIAADRAGLFAGVAGTLSSFGMNIVRAEAFSNRRGDILDTFAFEDPLHTLDLNASEVERLATVVERVLAGKTDIRQLLRNRPKAPPPTRKSAIAGRVSFNSEASQTATLVEIVAQDRPACSMTWLPRSPPSAPISKSFSSTPKRTRPSTYSMSLRKAQAHCRPASRPGEDLRRACAPA